MNYGCFSPDGREYIIERQDTPSPWINYLYNGEYFSSISNNAGGISYFKSPLHGRITRYRINDVPHDRPGKYIYVRDNDTGEFWSLSWQPTNRDPKAYRVAHGFGYTRMECEIDGIQSSVNYFVPLEDNQEVWKAILKNNTDRPRNLSVFGYVEFALGHAMVDLINQCDDQHFNRVYLDKKQNALLATKTYWVTESKGTQQQENKEWDQWTFFTVNHPVSGYETMREKFIGLYRNENNPIGLTQKTLGSQDTDYGNTVGALQIDLRLEPGESTDVIFSLGVFPKEASTKFDNSNNQNPPTGIQKYNTPEVASKALDDIIAHWDRFFAHTSVETPDPEVNIFMNYWTAYQAKVAFDVGRVTSFYYWGIGRGFGFRDTAQDTIAVTIAHPELALDRIKLLARQMQTDGKVYHHFHEDGQGEFTKHCDDPLWFILAVTEYIKETGEWDLLDHVETFIGGEKGSILDHLLSVVNYADNNRGKHGLPIFGRGDWNDTLDYIGGDDGGESVWGGMFYAAMLNRLIELLEFSQKDASEVIRVRDLFHQTIETHCWDGEWYIRAFGEKDKKIGTNANESGKIFLNTQSWAVIAGLPDQKKLLSSMDSVKKHLDTSYGPKICAPAYREIDPNIGLITRCVWGKKENGAIFNHPTAWLIQAECILGRGNMAYEYYRKLLPNRVDSDIFVAEPYVYSQYITSNEHSQPGRTSHSWQTGTAAWMFRINLDYILGIRPHYEGLEINPVIPSEWKEFKAQRIFRGCNYKIEVLNPEGVESGVKSIKVDGEIVEGNIISRRDAEVCEVIVVLGCSSTRPSTPAKTKD
ncbi:MAG: glycosyl transferase family 36 [Bacteroidota bacterium]|nr:glycosyl transferase family 36 [Bacteroidota bacterium]